MTGEEMERAIEFLFKNQAALDERFKAEREQTNQQIRELVIGQHSTQENLANLTQIVTQNTQQINHINNILLNLVEGQNRRDEEINALFKLVGGLIEGKNGKSES